ncbi:MAG TPA: zinc-ribbon domain-containing protein [Azospirillaceae bacterium]|nr:zinc-ribbon domain-containing protein [Azospirillaceae bacterium]
MILTCPECSTRYTVDAASLGPGGRAVRCTRCRHVWHQLPPLDAPHPVFLDEPDVESVFDAADDFDVGFGDDRHPDLVSMEPIRSEVPVTWLEPSIIIRWLALIVVVGGIVAGGWFGRPQVVALWPAAAMFYAEIGMPVPIPGQGLELQNVRSEQKIEGGTIVLMVEGQVTNVSDAPREVPPVKLVSMTPDHAPVRTWVVPVEPALLGPGESVRFQHVQPDPGPVAEVAVTFEGA